ncbi:MAG: hypothetical protein ACR2HN_00210 [Tepidiformaceae bacterium]
MAKDTEAFVYGGFLIHPVGQDPATDEPAVAFARWEGWTFQERRLDLAQVGRELAYVGLDAAGLQPPPGFKLTGGGIGLWTAPDGRVEAQGVTLDFEDGRHPPVKVHRGRANHYTTLGLFPFASPDLPNHALTVGSVAGRPALFFHLKPGVKGLEPEQVLVLDGPFVTTVEAYIDRYETLVEVAHGVVGSSVLAPDASTPDRSPAPLMYLGADGNAYTASR